MNSKVKELIESINKLSPKEQINIMEVCGTHTMAISRSGIRQLIPPSINLVSGPGCPVCVTPINDIDWIIEIINKYSTTIFTFGDIIRVPGSDSSLSFVKSTGSEIIICYSPIDAINFANVVLPVPGGPHNIIELRTPDCIIFLMAPLSPTRCS